MTQRLGSLSAPIRLPGQTATATWLVTRQPQQTRPGKSHVLALVTVKILTLVVVIPLEAFLALVSVAVAAVEAVEAVEAVAILAILVWSFVIPHRPTHASLG